MSLAQEIIEELARQDAYYEDEVLREFEQLKEPPKRKLDLIPRDDLDEKLWRELKYGKTH